MTKKDFKASVNPAEMFMTVVEDTPAPAPELEQEPSASVAREPKKKTVARDKRETGSKEPMPETKSKRLNLLIQPSVLEDFSKVAFMERNSMNDIINSLIKGYNDAHREEIETYNKHFKDLKRGE